MSRNIKIKFSWWPEWFSFLRRPKHALTSESTQIKWRKWLTFEVLFHFSAYFSDRLFLINLTLDWISYHTKMIKISKIFLLVNLISCRSQGSTDRNLDQNNWNWCSVDPWSKRFWCCPSREESVHCSKVRFLMSVFSSQSINQTLTD